jgi:hypothetical protein
MKDACLSKAEKMVGRNLTETEKSMLSDAYDMVESSGGVLLSRQAIAAILVSAKQIEVQSTSGCRCGGER